MDILRKNLMIRASAGSGKTYQLSNRVIGLVGRGGIDPERIVALTFTRKAAGEFADAVLEKLAKAALDAAERRKIEAALGGPFDAMEVLEKVVRALPRLALGTMDSFFTRVVRGFQYELGVTGGSFELLEGPQRRAKLDAVLGEWVSDSRWDEQSEEFLAAFRRATMGREQKAVVDLLLGFFQSWQEKWREHGEVLQEGLSRAFGDLPEVEIWESSKAKAVAGLRSASKEIEWTRKGQDEAMERALTAFETHTIGSGSLSGASGFSKGMMAWDGRERLVLKHYKEVVPGPVFEDRLRHLMKLLVGCELAAAVERTRAVLELVSAFDAACERQLRRRGWLGFDDVKVLMGEWLKSEASRLRREAVDFRLDARYDHWLLDEFQDTSGPQWTGLRPWIEEAASDEDSSMFVVGDAKQAIYGWRGGDVSLFETVRNHFQLVPESMPVSRRSCGAVLDFVNRVGADDVGLRRNFGASVADRWSEGWETHEPADPELTGFVRVEVIESREEDARYARVIELLEEIGVGRRALSCGVLVRKNDQVVELADRLREAGYQVIEEGRRRPTEDHVVGVALRSLMAWLANPADGMERGVVSMSPLNEALEERYGGFWQARWEGLCREVELLGFGGMLEGLVVPLRDTISEFGYGRAMDVVRALEGFDAAGGGSAREALQTIEKLEVAQEPGAAAVQVMTMHKSKGLGFDVVILPEISDEQVPNAGKFEMAEGPDWLLQPPAQWVRQRVPELQDAEARWGEAQQYEALCLLYVALTRAKRGLYVLLPKVPSSRQAEAWASPAEWVRSACGVDGGEAGVMAEFGDDDWLAEVPVVERKDDTVPVILQAPKPLRSRIKPSGETLPADAIAAPKSSSGMRFGQEVHAALEQIGWLDEEEPKAFEGPAGNWVKDLLEDPEVRKVFRRGGSSVELFREQPIEAILDGRWLSGVIDRLHVHDGGRRVEIIDFKTDGVTSAEELRERYAGPMNAYRRVMAAIYPEAQLDCLLLSTKLRSWIRLSPE
ncbi:ATP-dependent exoDNAse (exonuclease V) beta subunit [Haloferula luteola]|uniref:DNA 3'-5' helicase n=1 Tax=Haloferula luteola TaxID=595692 RepID=A0A840UYR8_9BACT|nr:UvrD-helicase domain-containing protein [Haloferula luteola]MBB5350153.1 ATP-dependent exoDNAse (exonuclease V) beta subunit [Haloferula luteola]